jgi:hypothetical protein
VISRIRHVLQSQASPLRMLKVPECGEEPLSPLTCVPLAIIEPSIQDGAKVDSIPDTEQARSKWVNSHYRGFCKLVGFPIDSHEQQCLELLRNIEETRTLKKGEVTSRKVISTASKGKREFKRLVSSVNYDGQRRVRC